MSFLFHNFKITAVIPLVFSLICSLILYSAFECLAFGLSLGLVHISISLANPLSFEKFLDMSGFVKIALSQLSNVAKSWRLSHDFNSEVAPKNII